MVSKKQKKAALQEKLQLLRSVTNSSAKNKTSIILDASKYIQQLKQKISACVQELAEDSSRPTVSVATLEKGLLINVSSTKSFPGMLVSILEVFENLGVEVLNANISCTDTFHLEAIGENQFGSVDALMVTDVVLQAMKKCTRSTDHKEQS
ncbi:transcription factor bHLH61-like isoform X1 [Typha angustifolia]|uniref:transcription factor bHLH61-like isoform X1 n=1 Tax=Typha angustifolia TaxID=59011 RepID=UPI003C2C71C0